MHAAIFDIDGTLIDSYVVDNAMYADAIRTALGDVRIRIAALACGTKRPLSGNPGGTALSAVASDPT